MEINVGLIEVFGVTAPLVAGVIIFIVKYESRLSKLEAQLNPILKLEPRVNMVEHEIKSLDIMKSIISEVGSERVQKVFKEKKE